MPKTKVCFITDNDFAVATAVAIQSLVENIATAYEINVLSANLDDFHKKKLRSFENIDVKINLIEADLNKYKSISNYNHVSTSALMKFDIAEIFNNDDRIIYLDSDIIVQKDFSEIYNKDFNHDLAMVVRDTGVEFTTKYNKDIGVEKYFNSGVMVLNLEKMRSERISEKLLFAKVNNPQWPFMDQHAFNYVFNKRVKWLEVKYNATIPLYRRRNYPLSDLNEFYSCNYNNLFEMQDDACIIHFAGEDYLRPWKVLNGTMTDIWTRYYNNSPYKNIDLQRTIYIGDTAQFREVKNMLNCSLEKSISAKVFYNKIGKSIKYIIGV